jgi:hypothetical protein
MFKDWRTVYLNIPCKLDTFAPDRFDRGECVQLRIFGEDLFDVAGPSTFGSWADGQEFIVVVL